MLTTKKWAVEQTAVLGLMVVLCGLSGCQPSGPTLARDGVRLLEQGKYERAIEKLVAARERLPGHAQLWNHLGLAYHGAYQLKDAINAYQQALRLDPNLAVARYNLGCLWLEQNEYAMAAEQLRSYTLLQPESADGWLRLATALLRDRKLDAAERSFAEVLKRAPTNIEALNSTGVLQLQRKRVREAALSFSAALAQNPKYGPALLNLAVVYHQHLNNRPLALQKYREYLALGTPPNAPAVQETVRQLEQELHLTLRLPATNQPVSVTLANAPARPATLAEQTKLPTPQATVPPTKTDQSPGPTNLPTPPPKTSPPPVLRADIPRSFETPPLVNKPSEAENLKPSNPPKPDPETPPAKVPLTQTNEPLATEQPRPVVETEKSSRWRYLNPASWLGSRKVPPITTPLPPSPQTRTPTPVEVAARIPADTTVKSEDVRSKAAPPTFARYDYLSPAKPRTGDPTVAEERFGAGVEAHENRRLAQAVEAYQAATRADPACFDAYYNWALAAYELGDLQGALTAGEHALAINPASVDARYNFALALQQAHYPLEAARELEKVVAGRPTEARAYLNLGNLYAQTLNQPQLARSNYLRVLQLDSRHPQATAIRFWLAANP